MWPPEGECDRTRRFRHLPRCCHCIHSVGSTAVVSVWLPVAGFQSHTTWTAGFVIVADVGGDDAADGDTAVTGVGDCTAVPDLGHGYRALRMKRKTMRTKTTTTRKAMELIDDAASIRT